MTSRQRTLRFIPLLAIASLGMVIIVPWNAATVGTGIDPSWIWALNEATEHGRSFGREFVFTYGPLGFLAPRLHHPGTVVMLWAWWSLLAVVWTVLLWRHISRALRSPLGRVAVLCSTAVVATISADAFFLTIPVLVGSIAVFADTRSDVRADLAAAAILLGVASLVKFTFLAAAFGTVVVLAMFDIWRRRWPTTATLSGVTFLIVWVALGQPLSNLWPYLGASVEIASGYGEAMSTPGNAYRATAWLLWAMIPATLASLYVAYQRRSGALVVHSLIVVGAAFVTFKAAYVRHDAPHEIIATAWAPVALCLAWIPLWHLDVSRRLKAVLVATVMLSLMGTTASVGQLNQQPPLAQVMSLPFQFVQNSTAMARPVDRIHRQNERYEAARARVRDAHPLPPGSGTVDVYPTELSVVFSHGYAYAPRPVPQSYSAYTPSLATLNAAHLAGQAAPENLLIDIAPIDGRLPSMEDGLSWPIIWAGYAVLADTAGFLWLRRRAVPLHPPAPRLLEYRRGRIGEEFRLPDVSCGGIWMQADLRPTIWYRLKLLFWKGPSVWMQFDNGTPDRRLIPTIVRSGFLVAPNIGTRQEFAEFMQRGRLGSGTDTRGTAIRIFVESSFPWRNFDEEYSLRLFRVVPAGACDT